MKRPGIIIMFLIITAGSTWVRAQQKTIINYSFQKSSLTLSKMQDIKINMIPGKTLVGVSKSDKLILKGNTLLSFKLQEEDEYASQDERKVPVSYSLEQNYPNPFNPLTRIRYSIPKEGYVSLAVYNMLGEKVLQLVDENKAPGIYTVEWEAQNFTSGIYLYSLKCNNYTESKKLILLK